MAKLARITFGKMKKILMPPLLLPLIFLLAACNSNVSAAANNNSVSPAASAEPGKEPTDSQKPGVARYYIATPTPLPKPAAIYGIANGDVLPSVKLSFTKTAILNGNPVENGTEVTDEGYYILTAANEIGERISVNFQIKREPLREVLLEIKPLCQFPGLYNGCEAVAVKMALDYYGYTNDLSRVNFALNQPRDKTSAYYSKGNLIWGDPDLGFVGDVTGVSKGYSINPEPLIDYINSFAPIGVDLTGEDFSVLQRYLSNGSPVVAWVTIGFDWPDMPETWLTPEGKTIYADYSIHAVTLTGYDDDYVYYNDPFYGTQNDKADRSWFLEIWNEMGNRAIGFEKAK
jgi:uncharacterized protein YvpB